MKYVTCEGRISRLYSYHIWLLMHFTRVRMLHIPYYLYRSIDKMAYIVQNLRLSSENVNLVSSLTCQDGGYAPTPAEEYSMGYPHCPWGFHYSTWPSSTRYPILISSSHSYFSITSHYSCITINSHSFTSWGPFHITFPQPFTLISWWQSIKQWWEHWDKWH